MTGTVTGDPTLEPEQLIQIDVGLAYDNGRFRSGINGFHAWTHDYITFENLDTFPSPPNSQQINLKFVNTDLATLVGTELFAEYDLTSWLTPFATLNFIAGRDHTRNGDFATREVMGAMPSIRVPGQPRGFFSGVSGASEEPLPNMAPLQSRLGLRLHEAAPQPSWSVELTARVVDNQDRVASSLLEQPTPGFTVWDVRGYWQATERLSLVAGVENFTDKNYREYLDFRPLGDVASFSMFQPGVNFYFGSELSY